MNATFLALGLALAAAGPAAPAPAHAPVPEAGAPVTFDEAIGLAAQAPAVAGAQAAAAEQRRVGDSVSSVIANPTLTLQPGAAKDPLDDQLTYMGEATLLQ
ncbi:MAG TPA: hypothetical protein VFM45_11810, partial [Anaeromyxobacteraceae bacterium]|nr:hypothetical protein [Anaeromyxobacteraceae bacterium]